MGVIEQDQWEEKKKRQNGKIREVEDKKQTEEKKNSPKPK